MTRYICQKCGDKVTMREEVEPWDCSYCGGRVVPEDKSDVTPNDDLRELIENFREHAEQNREIMNDSDPYGEGFNDAKEQCADQLERFVEQDKQLYE